MAAGMTDRLWKSIEDHSFVKPTQKSHSSISENSSFSRFDRMRGVQFFRWGVWLTVLGGGTLILYSIGVTGVAGIALVLGILAMVIGYAKARW